MNSRIITYIKEKVLVDAFYEDGHLSELSLISQEQTSLLGNIYVGRVKNIVKNIQAAFVEIAPGMLCYLPLEDVKRPIYTKPKRREHLAEGDELLVQVCREAVKTKAPSVTTNLNLNGKYLVITSGNLQIGYSSKLKALEKEIIKQWVSNWEIKDFGLIVRTSAAGVREEELKAEYEKLKKKYQFLTQQAIYRKVFSCVLENRPSYLNSLLGSQIVDKIMTDEREIYTQIQEFLQEEMPLEIEKLCLYEDKLLPLKSLYRLEKGLQEALSERVWLKSGAYLVIEPTEALTVIDINTGKCITGKNKEETIWKINQEAAKEIARQLRLRNLSGIILVDFVDMESKEQQQQLLEFMRQQVRKDPLKVTAIDITALGLMELTRKKQKKTLLEQAKECKI